MKPSENDLVARVARSTGGLDCQGLRIGIGDDAALLTTRLGHETILTCDWFLEGTHFLRHRHPPDSVGWKCLARALSDIAAMGGSARCFLLGLALPEELTGRWLTQFLAGSRRAARRFHCVLAGGDTTHANKVLINVTVIGDVRVGHGLLRSGAKPGDLICVSGRLGEAEMGLTRLRAEKTRPRLMDAALRKHLYPEPRLELSQFLAKHKLATAMMDLSDGLSTDLPRLCASSRVGARLEAASIPRPRARSRTNAARATDSQLLDFALNGGDDYELLFTASPRKIRRIPASFRDVPLTRIGEITRSRRVLLCIGSREEPLQPQGWDPFRGEK